MRILHSSDARIYNNIYIYIIYILYILYIYIYIYYYKYNILNTIVMEVYRIIRNYYRRNEHFSSLAIKHEYVASNILLVLRSALGYAF